METLIVADEFEDFLIKTLDMHNMLMANKSETDETPGGNWDFSDEGESDGN
jgi:hypothetical protein